MKKQLRLIITIGFLLLGLFLALYGIKRFILDPRGQASVSDEVLWSFSLVGDTQAGWDPGVMTLLMNRTKSYNPRMLINVGDGVDADAVLGFFMEMDLVTRADFDHPFEYHFAPGNHDDSGGCAVLKSRVRTAACSGLSSDLFEDGREVPNPNVPMNPEVNNVSGYCQSGGSNHQYSFVRGNIKFIMLDMPYYCSVPEKRQYFKQEVCNPGDTSATLVFLHENDFPKLRTFIDNLDCEHNLKAIITGHGHTFENIDHGGVKLIEVSGMFWIRGDYGDGDKLDDVWVAEIYSDRIAFSRAEISAGVPGSQITPFQEIFTIPGEFSNYCHPESDDCSGFVSPPASEDTATIEYDLDPGIHLISVPVVIDDYKVSDLMDDVNEQGGNVTEVAYFRSGNWKSYRVVNGEVFAEEDFAIVPGQGYLVRVGSNSVFSIEGNLPSEAVTIEFKHGWNFVGVHRSTQNYDAESLIRNLNDSGLVAKIVSKYESERFNSLVFDDEQVFGHGFTIDFNSGYFVYVEDLEENGTWSP